MDGHETAPRSLPFIYVGVAGPRAVRVYDAPGAQRLLYRREDECRFVFAGHSHRRCEGCGAIHAAVEGACSLCGGKLILA